MTGRTEAIADGFHAGLRWYVERMTNADNPVVTINGNLGSRYVHHSAEYVAPTPAMVKRLCEQLAADPDKRTKR